MATLHDLTSNLPPAHAPADAATLLRADLRRARAKVVVLDDDPTGTQVVADVPVITAWQDADLDWALAQPTDVFYVLTNSRSLQPAAAVALNRDLGERLARRAAAAAIGVRCVSRSDSTLRGHFPAEVDALSEGLGEGGMRPDVTLLCPAFLNAGRITVNDTHYVRDGDAWTAAAETEFARDLTFGYRHSNLIDWAVERGVPRERTTSIPLAAMRANGPDFVARRLLRARGQVVIANAVVAADLEVLALGAARAEAQGLRVLYRTGPSFVGVRAGLQPARPLHTADIAPLPGPGLLVVGSHTALTTRQLAVATESHDLKVVELRADRLSEDGDEVRRCAAALTASLREGDGALVTSRGVMGGLSAADSLAIAQRVAAAVVDVVARIGADQPLGWVVAKGGITSSDLAVKAFRTRRAHVVGQIFDQLVSVWRLDGASNRPNMPYVVFPGNVGDDLALAETIDRMKSAAGSGVTVGEVQPAGPLAG